MTDKAVVKMLDILSRIDESYQSLDKYTSYDQYGDSEYTGNDQDSWLGQNDDVLQGVRQIQNTDANTAQFDRLSKTGEQGIAYTQKSNLTEPEARKYTILNERYTDSKHFSYLISELRKILNKNQVSIKAVGAHKKPLQDRTTSLDGENYVSLYDAIMICASVRGTQFINDKKIDFRGNVQNVLRMIVGNDCTMLRAFIYALYLQSYWNTQKDTASAKYATNVKLIVKKYLGFNNIQNIDIEGMNITVSNVLDDPLIGNESYKQGVAISLLKQLLEKFELTNGQNIREKLQTLHTELGVSGDVPKVTGNPLHSVAEMLAFFLVRILSNYKAIMDSSYKYNLKGRESYYWNRRLHLLDSSMTAIDFYLHNKDADLFQNVTIEQLLDNNYMFTDWFKTTKSEYAEDIKSLLQKLSELGVTIEELSPGESSDDDYISVYRRDNSLVGTFAEFIATAQRGAKYSHLEQETFEALSSFDQSWQQQVNGTDTGTVTEIQKLIGAKSLDFASEKLGVAVEAQGIFHFMSRSMFTLKPEDLQTLGGLLSNQVAESRSAGDAFISSNPRLKTFMDELFYEALSDFNGGNVEPGQSVRVEAKKLGTRVFELLESRVRRQADAWNSINYKAVFYDEIRTYRQQMNDKDKFLAITQKLGMWKNGIKWKMLYIIQRGVSPQTVNSALSIPFRSSTSADGTVTYLGKREEIEVNNAIPNIFYEGTDISKMSNVFSPEHKLQEWLMARVAEIKK